MAGRLGRDNIPPISANILGDSGLNIITGKEQFPMCGRELVSGCTDELEYSKLRRVAVGARRKCLSQNSEAQVCLKFPATSVGDWAEQPRLPAHHQPALG